MVLQRWLPRTHDSAIFALAERDLFGFSFLLSPLMMLTLKIHIWLSCIVVFSICAVILKHWRPWQKARKLTYSLGRRFFRRKTWFCAKNEPNRVAGYAHDAYTGYDAPISVRTSLSSIKAKCAVKTSSSYVWNVECVDRLARFSRTLLWRVHNCTCVTWWRQAFGVPCSDFFRGEQNLIILHRRTYYVFTSARHNVSKSLSFPEIVTSSYSVTAWNFITTQTANGIVTYQKYGTRGGTLNSWNVLGRLHKRSTSTYGMNRQRGPRWLLVHRNDPLPTRLG